VLRLAGEQVESLFDEALPIEVRELPEDLARLDELLSEPGLLAPIAARWDVASRDRGRPTIAMTMFVRLMVVKQRSGWGYETLVREVSDSFHLRRFVGLSVTSSVPHESTIRKLALRLGPEVVDEITRVLIERPCVSGASRPERCGWTPPSWSPMCAGPRTPRWRWMPLAVWLARALA
jgi:IS5 family transposase